MTPMVEIRKALWTKALTERAKMRHHTERDMELAEEARRQYQQTQDPERLDLIGFYLDSVLETLKRRLQKLSF